MGLFLLNENLGLGSVGWVWLQYFCVRSKKALTLFQLCLVYYNVVDDVADTVVDNVVDTVDDTVVDSLTKCRLQWQ